MTWPSGADAAAGAVVRRTVVIENERGLHARAAAKFVQVAGSFDADITVQKDGTVVSGRSIMGLMMLAAGPGCEIELAASGREAEEAIESLARLVAAKFEET
ncbi:MAG: HPr family phosphocarrier protein [Alphaproteobacteria bacterium]